MKTVFVAAYDTEAAERCRMACERIVEVHHEMNVPATFFIVSKLLEGAERADYKRLLDAPKFEIASHSATHPLLRDHPALNGKGVSWEQVQTEVRGSKATIEDCFGRPCIGFRTPCGFEDGLGDRALVELVAQSGYAYSSSVGWGPKYSLPVPILPARTYAAEGCPDLWEYPLQGWHENVLKGHNATPGRFLLWPPVYPDHVVTRFVKRPEEEFEVHRYFIDKAIELEHEYATLIWHPWSLGKFDPEMRMLKLCFEYVRARGLECITFAELHARQGRMPARMLAAAQA
ncbi:MAG: polysaccharide deacetylase family protein [Planctomycetes bacterium]|nr:polysaccharide deacetylase family protein [Planctomycetota bacterium]